MKGHIKLGTSVADLREYMLTDPNALGMQLSNQMAAKLGQGAGKYDDLQNWSAWVMDDWSAGAGNTDAEGGGYLFGDIDSRVPRQLMLPPAQGEVDFATQNNEYSVMPMDLGSTPGVTLVSEASGDQLIWNVTAWANDSSIKLWLYASIPYGSTITVKRYDDTNVTLQTTDTFTANILDNGHRWHSFALSGSVTAATGYALRVSVNAAWTVFTVNSSFDATTPPFFKFLRMTPVITKVARFNGELYGMASQSLYKYDTVNKNWDTVSSTANNYTDAVAWNNKLYLGSTGATFYTMNTSEVISAGAVAGQFFYQWNGYLYRVVDDSLYYTADGTTWSGPFRAEPNEDIQAMAGMGNDVYFASLNGLYRLAPGDTIYGVMQWGKRAGNIGKYTTDNGTPAGQCMPGMAAWQGDIYIAVDGSIYRFSANGQTTDIWLKDGGDLPASYVGRISALTTTNNYLIASVADSSGNSVWVWNKQGWHPLGFVFGSSTATLGLTAGQSIYTMYYDRVLGRLWVNHLYANMYISFPDLTQNPYTYSGEIATAPVFMPSGWMETHWFDGNLLEIKKDFESIYVTGDRIGAQTGANTYVKIYWQDDASTGWELLGTADSTREEIRWTSVSTRPDSRQIKVAIRIDTDSVIWSPRVEAIRVKYMSMLLDRYRWTLPVAVSANQEMLDLTLNTYTLAQQVTHLNSLINAVAPIYFEDVNGTQYEVKVLGASRAVRDFEYRNPSTAKVYKLVYSIVIEQVVSNINT